MTVDDDRHHKALILHYALCLPTITVTRATKDLKTVNNKKIRIFENISKIFQAPLPALLSL